MSFISSLLEGVGLTMIVPLLSFVEKVGAGSDNVVIQIIEKVFLFFGITFSIKSVIIIICLLFFVKAVVLFLASYIKLVITNNYEANTRKKLFKSVLRTDWSFLSKQKLGFLEQSLMTDVHFSSLLFLNISGIIIIAMNLLIYTLVIINLSPWVAFLTILLSGLVFFVLKPLYYRTKSLSSEISKWYKEVSHFINQYSLGIKSIKSMFVDKALTREAYKYFDNYKRLNLKIATFGSFVGVVAQPISIFFVVAIFAFFYKTGQFNYGSFAVIIYAIYRIFVHVQSAQVEIHRLNVHTPFLINLLNYEKEMTDSQEKDSGKDKFLFSQDLVFKNLSFSYGADGEGEDKNVLSSINFSIKKGEIIGIIGPSGAGKTTLVDLILRLNRPQSGSILLDGKDINDISIQDWRKKIGYVSQDIFLLNDTIENNIKFYKNNLKEVDILEATKMANIDGFIESLPNKMSTEIGERGVLLSGGQRQRIVLARILARKPQLLVLDEATSALDSESELSVQKAVQKLKGHVTVLVIAHRLSTVSNVDRLIVLDKGRIIEEGAPADLLEDKKSYFYRVSNLGSNFIL
ncbi:ABC transporter ATP-binding protein/permease [Patescibacteria group bacterium]|nr:ABC transporter ATP-binding protein/permease [Patescibacteria group bacterium]